MRFTNKDRYDHAWEQLEARVKPHIAALFPNGIPSTLYRVEGYKRISELTVMYAGYDHGAYRRQSPTRADEAEIEALLIEPFVFNPERLFIHWSEQQEKYRTEGAIKYTSIDGVKIGWDRQSLEPELQHRKEIYEPREGYTACAYCGKQSRTEDMHIAQIWSPNWKATGGLSPKRYYCNAGCAGYDQMAHEG